MNRFFSFIFILTLCLASMCQPVLAQQSYALKPYAITLPRVTTTQQVNPATVPQSAGNVVYNTTEQKVAINTGRQWEYLGSHQNDAYPNFTAFYEQSSTPQQWTIPAGITKFMVEVWGGGTGGMKYRGLTTFGDCRGGSAAGYAQKIYSVVSGITTVTVVVGRGGSGTTVAGNPGPAQLGTESRVFYPTEASSLFATSGAGAFGPGFGGFSGTSPDGYQPFVVEGSSIPHVTPVSYTQKDASNYVVTLKLSDGGTAYGVRPGIAGIGPTIILLNNDTATTIFGGSGAGALPSQDGSFPGGGGACGYSAGGNGANGLVIIRW